MRQREENLLFSVGLLIAIWLVFVGRAASQTFTTLHNFAGINDGANPAAGLILAGQILYGTARTGGGSGHGTVFAVGANGSGFTNLHDFGALNYSSAKSAFTNDDGAYPYATLVLSGNTLYGTAAQGGQAGGGTVFALNIDGTKFTIVHNLAGYPNEPSSAEGVLLLSSGTLYGVSRQGGSSDVGAVFKVNTDGSSFSNLYSFATTDGCHVEGGPILIGSTLYSPAREGGSSQYGTVFAINEDGSDFTTLYNFSTLNNSANGDGANPVGSLVVLSNTLYGTAQSGGTSGFGTIYSLNSDGRGFEVLHSFTSLSGSVVRTNTDGASPWSGLILWGTTLYGTTRSGGIFGAGTVFQVNIDGNGFSILHNFAADGSEGMHPRAGLLLSEDTLYGTTEGGGSAGLGTVFSLQLGPVSLPQPTIVSSGTNVVLMWPTNLANVTLECTTNLAAPITWSTVAQGASLVNGLNIVTNAMSGTQQYYRLVQR
jgi:uncharacterized repeat protein (TIGR03803 family)